jgi:acyl-coenzyme A synthetase/AMP-(fatty) acid ligase
VSNATTLSEIAQMRWTPITKDPSSWPVQPNLADWAKAGAGFSWEEVRQELCGRVHSANIGELAVDRLAAGPLRDHVALRWLGRDGRVLETTFGHLRDQSNRFANMLRWLGIGKQDPVFALAGRIPSLYTAALGTLKNTSVFCPLFSAFGPEPVRQRLERGNAKVLVTTERLYRRTIEPLRRELPELRHILIADAGHMVGPFEVERALMEHPAVAEAGVIGKPDSTIGEIVKAFVALKLGQEGNDQLRLELIGFARKKLGAAIAPKEIEFCSQIPRTRSGKIVRRLLKARELGLPEGDLSTLETPA